MAEKKEDKKEIKEDAIKEKKAKTKKEDVEIKETKTEKVEKAEKKVEEVKVAEAETLVEDNMEADARQKSIVNIVAIGLILIALILGIILVAKKPSPKRSASDYLNLSTKNPIEAFLKYGISEFQEEKERVKGKYVTYKIDEVGEIEKKDGKERVEVSYTRKGPNSFRIEEEVKENLKKRDINLEDEEYNFEYIKELKKLLHEKKDQLEETKDTIMFYRNPKERNWKIETGL